MAGTLSTPSIIDAKWLDDYAVRAGIHFPSAEIRRIIFEESCDELTAQRCWLCSPGQKALYNEVWKAWKQHWHRLRRDHRRRMRLLSAYSKAIPVSSGRDRALYFLGILSWVQDEINIAVAQALKEGDGVEGIFWPELDLASIDSIRDEFHVQFCIREPTIKEAVGG